MHEPVHTEVYKGKKIRIHYDDDSSTNPRRDCDNLGRMLCFHRRYDLGDEKSIAGDYHASDFDGWEAMRAHLEKEHHAVIILPLFLYDHSGITMSVGEFGDRFDSGQVGFLYVSRADILKWYGKKLLTKRLRAQAEEALRAEVKVYDYYLTGQVYEYDIEGTEESCCGFIGELKDIIAEAKAVIDRLDKDEQDRLVQKHG